MKLFKVKASSQVIASDDLQQALSYNDLAKSLEKVLLTTRQLEYRARQYHWNILGDKFERMHNFYEREYDELTKDIDVIAEQIRQLGYLVTPVALMIDGSFFYTKYENQLASYKKAIDENIQALKQANDLATKMNHAQTMDMCSEIMRKRSIVSHLRIDAMEETNNKTVASTTEVKASFVTAGFDKSKYKEYDEAQMFFKILKDECNIKTNQFYSVNRGLRLAIRLVKESYPDASIRFFAKKNAGGYIRIELGDGIFIIGYTIYESGKIKVWTRQLKTNISVNSFSIDNLGLIAKPITSKLPKYLMPIWLSI